MNFLTTGHTSGIGKAIYNHFGGKGLSRSTGFDITKNNILPHLDGIDVFVNNAYSRVVPLAQTKILYKSLSVPKIICIGSNATVKTTKKYNPDDKQLPNTYEYAKLALENSCDHLFYQNYDITLIKPGYVDTPVVEYITKSKLSTNDIIETVEWILFQSFRVKEITIIAKRNNDLS